MYINERKREKEKTHNAKAGAEKSNGLRRNSGATALGATEWCTFIYWGL